MNRSTDTFSESLEFIQTRNGIVYPSEISDELLDVWIDPQATERTQYIEVARTAPMLILKETPDDSFIPLKVFIYTYDRYCRENYKGHRPGCWFDPLAEKRYVEFQFLMQALRYDRDNGTKEYFPEVNIFDYANYSKIVWDTIGEKEREIRAT